MIEVSVGEKQVEVDRHVLEEFVPKRAQTCARVKYHRVVTALHFETGCVAAVADSVGTWTRNASADAPKPDAKLGLIIHSAATRNAVTGQSQVR